MALTTTLDNVELATMHCITESIEAIKKDGWRDYEAVYRTLNGVFRAIFLINPDISAKDWEDIGKRIAMHFEKGFPPFSEEFFELLKAKIL